MGIVMWLAILEVWPMLKENRGGGSSFMGL